MKKLILTYTVAVHVILLTRFLRQLLSNVTDMPAGLPAGKSSLYGVFYCSPWGDVHNL